jgi:hypothetical protein
MIKIAYCCWQAKKKRIWSVQLLTGYINENLHDPVSPSRIPQRKKIERSLVTKEGISYKEADRNSLNKILN